MKLLIDNSIRADAIRSEHGFLKLEGTGEVGHNSHVIYTQRVRPDRTDWRQGEIDVLPQIADLIRKGLVKGCVTDELELEALSAEKFPSPVLEDIFDGCTLEKIPAPIDRSKWGMDMDQALSREQVIKYCEGFFLTPTDERIEAFILGMRKNPRLSLSEFEENCLRNVRVFREICRGIDRKHYPDALHLWTAEENGVDVFLLNDKKFINVISRQKVNLHCKLMLPTDFIKYIEEMGAGMP
jgi:hypothetical protein